jgi:hypothetical protein
MYLPTDMVSQTGDGQQNVWLCARDGNGKWQFIIQYWLFFLSAEGVMYTVTYHLYELIR